MILENLRLLTAPDAMTVEQRAAAAALEPYYERAKAAFGLDFANEFWEKQARANELELAEAFDRGFRLGGPPGPGTLPGEIESLTPPSGSPGTRRRSSCGQ